MRIICSLSRIILLVAVFTSTSATFAIDCDDALKNIVTFIEAKHPDLFTQAAGEDHRGGFDADAARVASAASVQAIYQYWNPPEPSDGRISASVALMTRESLQDLFLNAVRIWHLNAEPSSFGSRDRYRVDIYSGMNFMYFTHEAIVGKSEQGEYFVESITRTKLLQGGAAANYNTQVKNGETPNPQLFDELLPILENPGAMLSKPDRVSALAAFLPKKFRSRRGFIAHCFGSDSFIRFHFDYEADPESFALEFLRAVQAMQMLDHKVSGQVLSTIKEYSTGYDILNFGPLPLHPEEKLARLLALKTAVQSQPFDSKTLSDAILPFLDTDASDRQIFLNTFVPAEIIDEIQGSGSADQVSKSLEAGLRAHDLWKADSPVLALLLELK